MILHVVTSLLTPMLLGPLQTDKETLQRGTSSMLILSHMAFSLLSILFTRSLLLEIDYLTSFLTAFLLT